MSIKRGDVVSHSTAADWGVGKVVETGPDRVSILFNDGITRKIACSHLGLLLPAAHDSFLPASADLPKIVPRKAVKAAPVGKKKAKL